MGRGVPHGRPEPENALCTPHISLISAAGLTTTSTTRRMTPLTMSIYETHCHAQLWGQDGELIAEVEAPSRARDPYEMHWYAPDMQARNSAARIMRQHACGYNNPWHLELGRDRRVHVSRLLGIKQEYMFADRQRGHDVMPGTSCSGVLVGPEQGDVLDGKPIGTTGPAMGNDCRAPGRARPGDPRRANQARHPLRAGPGRPRRSWTACRPRVGTRRSDPGVTGQPSGHQASRLSVSSELCRNGRRRHCR